MLRGGATAAYVGESLFDLLTRTALSATAHRTLRDLARQRHHLSVDAVLARGGDFLETLGLSRVQDRLGRADQPAAAASHSRASTSR